MNEEVIDIIELLKRVKEGKAPKKIEIIGVEFRLEETYKNCPEDYPIKYWYIDNDKMYEGDWLNTITGLDTKIKILDKPIIEELKMVKSMDGKVSAYPNEEIVFEKINEIINHINKGE